MRNINNRKCVYFCRIQTLFVRHGPTSKKTYLLSNKIGEEIYYIQWIPRSRAQPASCVAMTNSTMFEWFCSGAGENEWS